MKKILIIGITGQDGSILATKFISENVKVVGTYRRGSDTGSDNKLWRLKDLQILNRVILEPLELNDPFSIQKIIKKHKPQEIYHLAGSSFVQDSFDFPLYTIQTNVNSVINILESVKLINKSIKVFFASSSEIFDSDCSLIKNEKSKKSPRNPYGISKLTILNLVDLYRKTYDMNLSTGIMFNHESPYRSRSYVTRKITFNLARIKLEGGKPMQLGNLNTSRDWGCAYDYTDAMKKIIKNDLFEDFVISSGKLTSLRSIVLFAARQLDFNPKFVGKGLNEKCIDSKTGIKLIEVNKKYFRIHDTVGMVGDSSLLKSKIDWIPKNSIENTIIEMVKKDLERINKK